MADNTPESHKGLADLIAEVERYIVTISAPTDAGCSDSYERSLLGSVLTTLKRQRAALEAQPPARVEPTTERLKAVRELAERCATWREPQTGVNDTGEMWRTATWQQAGRALLKILGAESSPGSPTEDSRGTPPTDERLRSLVTEWRRREEVWRAGQQPYSDGAATAYKTSANELEALLGELVAAPTEDARGSGEAWTANVDATAEELVRMQFKGCTHLAHEQPDLYGYRCPGCNWMVPPPPLPVPEVRAVTATGDNE